MTSWRTIIYKIDKMATHLWLTKDPFGENIFILGKEI